MPKSAKVSDFVYYYYNPWDPSYLVYLVYDCSEEDFEVECQRLRQIDSSARYAYYGVTGFPYKLEAVLANAYYGLPIASLTRTTIASYMFKSIIAITSATLIIHDILQKTISRWDTMRRGK
ncbi:MAG: hypothetical protein ACLR23_04210 [Clostridia bacterium]